MYKYADDEGYNKYRTCTIPKTMSLRAKRGNLTGQADMLRLPRRYRSSQ
jgi:hypothetical protein